MTLAIVWRPAARADLLALYDWIAHSAGRAIAYDYTAGIEAQLAVLVEHPMIGTARDDLCTGLRTLTYRRRTTIAYRVLGETVEVVRLAHAGRDLGRLFTAED